MLKIHLLISIVVVFSILDHTKNRNNLKKLDRSNLIIGKIHKINKRSSME